jgi:hypothetical protein
MVPKVSCRPFWLRRLKAAQKQAVEPSRPGDPEIDRGLVNAADPADDPAIVRIHQDNQPVPCYPGDRAGQRS